MSHKLLAGLWMLALAEFREVLGGNGLGKAELLDQSPLPFARDDALRVRDIALASSTRRVGGRLFDLEAKGKFGL